MPVVGPLTQSVSLLCQDLHHSVLPEAACQQVLTVANRLRQPLQLAVAGKVSSGKSTLVNALLGRRLSLVQPEETRVLTTAYRWGDSRTPRIELVRQDGTRTAAKIDDTGCLPSLGDRDAVAAERFEVYINAPLLKCVNLIDTPGLFSADKNGMSRQGEAAVLGDRDTRLAMRAAEAVLFVLTDISNVSDTNMLTQLRAGLLESNWGFGAVAVLGKVDTINALEPFIAAEDLMNDLKAHLGVLVADVVCASPILALASCEDELSEDDISLLKQLSTCPQFDMVDQTFERYCAIGTASARGALLAKLGKYGVNFAVGVLRRDGDARHLREQLWTRSGLPSILNVISGKFEMQADAIKASVALSDLTAVAEGLPPSSSADARMLLAEIERLRRHREFHALRESYALDCIRRAEAGQLPRLRMEASLREEVATLLTGSTAAARLGLPPTASRAEMCAVSARARARWRRTSNDRVQSLTTRRIADIVLETHARMFQVDL